MTDAEGSSGSRAAFHRQFQAQALDEARRLLAQREVMGAAWLNWVAAQLYQLSPPPYAAMVRRELQCLAQG